MKRPIALKIIKPEIASDQETISDFIKEIQLLASFNHPNIVTAIEAGRQGNLYFLAMEYIEGISLDEPLLEGRIFKEKETLTYIKPIVEALERAWIERQMIHCDIKPANIMLNKRDEPKLMDLGISRSVNDDSTSEQIVGTPFFMSPEQASAEKLDFRSDIFSLGSSMFYMLTGKLPFEDSSPLKVLECVKYNPLPVEILKETGISAAVIALIEKMCAKELDQRHSFWQEVLIEIERCLNPPKKKSKKGPVKKTFISDNHVSQRASKRVKQRSRKKSAVPAILLVMLTAGYLTYHFTAKGILVRDNTEPTVTKKSTPTNSGGASSSAQFIEERPEPEPFPEKRTIESNDKPDQVVQKIPTIHKPERKKKRLPNWNAKPKVKKKGKSIKLIKTSSAALNALVGSERITELRIIDSSLTDLKVLETLPNLKKLELSNCKIFDASALKKLHKLEFFVSNSTNINFRHLQGLPQLRFLKANSIQNMNIFLGSFKSLEYLGVSGRQLHDLKYLRFLKSLKYLSLNKANVKELSSLNKLQGLITLEIINSEVESIAITESQAHALQRALNCKLNFAL